MSITAPLARRIPAPGRYEVSSELVTFSAGAGPELAGTTAERWRVVADGRLVAGVGSWEEALRFAAGRAAGDQPLTVALASGRQAVIPARLVADFLGLDAAGLRVAHSPIGPVALTACCCATGTGGATGVECRACHRTVSAYFGDLAGPVVDCRTDTPSWQDRDTVCVDCGAAFPAAGPAPSEQCSWSSDSEECRRVPAVPVDDAALRELGLIG